MIARTLHYNEDIIRNPTRRRESALLNRFIVILVVFIYIGIEYDRTAVLPIYLQAFQISQRGDGVLF